MNMTFRSAGFRYRRRRAFTIIELLVVMTLIGVMAAIAVPKFRVSKKMHVRMAARQLMRDMEIARNRALGLKRLTRVQFTTGSQQYVGYVDDDNNGAIGATSAEILAMRGFPTRVLQNNVVFGRGNATAGIPGEAGSGAVTFTSTRVEFDTRGMPTPFRTRGTIYLTATGQPGSVFAVQMTGSGSFKLWEYLPNGTWQ
jgi:prepilin-type N-terminal cleavage/methylation domain-containing protein